MKRLVANHEYRDYLFDSGAFTFMNGASTDVNWDEYVERYATTINEYDIQKFFELDIDSIVGLTEVERLRARLEQLTNKRCIPVWHKSRGLDYWSKMVQAYDYCAVGGIAIKTIKRNQYGLFRQLISEAHAHGCRVHGLGFTQVQLLEQFDFDSVDSSSCNGARFGQVAIFTGTSIRTIKPPKGKRLDHRKATEVSFDAWRRYANYLEFGVIE